MPVCSRWLWKPWSIPVEMHPLLVYKKGRERHAGRSAWRLVVRVWHEATPYLGGFLPVAHLPAPTIRERGIECPSEGGNSGVSAGKREGRDEVSECVVCVTLGSICCPTRYVYTSMASRVPNVTPEQDTVWVPMRCKPSSP